jgi:uncharacterized membrane protein YoaK (UPF0700 family)
MCLERAVTRYDKRIQLFAVCLSALAGYVDAIGFIKLGGFFISFMSGNSTRLAVGLAQGSAPALQAAGLVATFVTGVVVGSLVGKAARRRRRTVLSLVALLLVAAAMLGGLGAPSGAIAAMALAMGAENAVFEQDGEVHIGLTYMTGTLVKLGQRIATGLLGGDRWAWRPYLLLWLGLILGATAGAAVYPSLGLGGLWIAAAAAGLIAVAIPEDSKTG